MKTVFQREVKRVISQCQMKQLKQFSDEIDISYSRANNPLTRGVHCLTSGRELFLGDLGQE